MDFTFKTYEKLLTSLHARGFLFYTYDQYVEVEAEVKENSSKHISYSSTTVHRSPFTVHSKIIILRHDVESRYPNALKMAEIEHSLGIKGSYYFRIFPIIGNEAIIKQIAALGHEIGYHYDDLTHCNGDHEKAILRFQKNLSYLRQFGPVTTITMEGAPLSKYDNRDLWKKREMRDEKTEERDEKGQMNDAREILTSHRSPLIAQVSQSQSPFVSPSLSHSSQHSDQPPHYSHFGILAEPYLDLDFNKVFYLTDTGRRWDGYKVSVRDKIPGHQERWNEQGLTWHTTPQLINAINNGQLPNQVMMTFHPQRWNDKPITWLKEFVWQKVKNQGKRFFVTLRKGDKGTW